MSNKRPWALNVLANPIFIKCARARLRPKHVVAWGAVVLVFTTFVFLLVYLTAYERGILNQERAARSAIIPLIVIQAVILMLLGTGSVASGLAIERDTDVLDYHRINPMSPTSKIVGYLFGLPVREYVLFLITVPFLLFAVFMGGLAWLTVAHFYAVFFSSVWLYHMTGLVAGMVSPKPRRAGLFAQGMVVGLYIFLRPLANVGVTFLGYLTVYPTFMAMVYEEVAPADQASTIWVTHLRQVPFFNFTVHSTLFTLLLQAGLIFSLFIVVHRKWRQETNHSYGKVYSMIFFAAVQLLLVGSFWPFLMRERGVTEMVNLLGGGMSGHEALPAMLGVFMGLFFAISLCVALLMIHVITPSLHGYGRGLRRARKLGLPRVPVTSDAASNLPYGLAYIVMMTAAYFILIALAHQSGGFFDENHPTTMGLLGLPLLAAGLVAYLMAARACWDARAFFLFLFMLWFIPLFTFAILTAAWGHDVVGAYVGLPCPAVSFYLAIALLVDDPWVWPTTENLRPHLPALVACGVLLQVALTVAFLSLRRRAHRRVRQQAWVAQPPTPAAV